MTYPDATTRTSLKSLSPPAKMSLRGSARKSLSFPAKSRRSQAASPRRASGHIQIRRQSRRLSRPLGFLQWPLHKTATTRPRRRLRTNARWHLPVGLAKTTRTCSIRRPRDRELHHQPSGPTLRYLNCQHHLALPLLPPQNAPSSPTPLRPRHDQPLNCSCTQRSGRRRPLQSSIPLPPQFLLLLSKTFLRAVL